MKTLTVEGVEYRKKKGIWQVWTYYAGTNGWEQVDPIYAPLLTALAAAEESAEKSKEVANDLISELYAKNAKLIACLRDISADAMLRKDLRERAAETLKEIEG